MEAIWSDEKFSILMLAGGRRASCPAGESRQGRQAAKAPKLPRAPKPGGQCRWLRVDAPKPHEQGPFACGALGDAALP